MYFPVRGITGLPCAVRLRSQHDLDAAVNNMIYEPSPDMVAGQGNFEILIMSKTRIALSHNE